MFPGASDYILQGGTVAGQNEEATVGTPFLNENAQQLAFTGTYQLAMANAGVNPSLPGYTQGVNTDDNQFFITTGSPNQVLGYGYTIFGQMLAGQDVIAKMTQVPLVTDTVLGSKTQPANPLVITSLSFSTGNPSGVAIIDTSQARPGDTATFQVTATDAHGSVSQDFTVTASPYTANSLMLGAPAIDFKPFANAATATVAEGGSTPITVTGQNGYPDTTDTQYFNPTYSYTVVEQPSHGKLTLTSSLTTTPTAAYTYTPDPGYSGPDSFQYTITEDGPTPYLGSNQNTGALYFGPAEPTTSNPTAVTITVTPTPTPTPTTPTPTPTSPTPTPTSPTPTPISTPTPPIPAPLVTVTGVVDVTNRKHQVTAIHVTFSGALNPAEAADTAIYQLIKQGKHKSFVASRATTIKIKSASYDPTDTQVTLIPGKPFALSKPVEVLVEGQLQDAEGRLIDGNRDGQPGGNATAVLSKGGASLVAMVTAAPRSRWPTRSTTSWRSRLRIASSTASPPPG